MRQLANVMHDSGVIWASLPSLALVFHSGQLMPEGVELFAAEVCI